MKKIILGSIFSVFTLALLVTPAFAAKPADNGFDEFGYNNTARVFVGTCLSWAEAGGMSRADASTYCGVYSSDKLVMKWNAAWDACNANGYDDPIYCLGAWTSNEWNGAVPGGSGEVWHYKDIWVGSAGEDSLYWLPGGYSIWGNYEVVMDQGTSDGVHFWGTRATPNGYGAVFGR